MDSSGRPPQAGPSGASSSQRHLIKNRSSAAKQDSQEKTGGSSVKRKGTISRKIRRESGTYTSKRRPSAADFWANFNYVDVVGREEKSKEREGKHHHYKHTSQHAHPHHHRTHRTSSESKRVSRSGTLDSDRKQSIVTAFSVSSPGDQSVVTSEQIKMTEVVVVTTASPSGQLHKVSSRVSKTPVTSTSRRIVMKQMSLQDHQPKQVVSAYHEQERRPSSLISLDSLEATRERPDGESEAKQRHHHHKKKESVEIEIEQDQEYIMQDKESYLMKTLPRHRHIKKRDDEQDISAVQVIEVDEEDEWRTRRGRRKKKKEEQEQVEVEPIIEGTGEEEPEEAFDPNRPYPEFAEHSFNCLSQTSKLRQRCIRMIMNPYPASDKITSTL